jgi:cytochrome c-type biogenesis protein CcmH/NrfG
MKCKQKENKIAEFITEMNAYLEQNPNDGEVWIELGDLYLEYQK